MAPPISSGEEDVNPYPRAAQRNNPAVVSVSKIPLDPDPLQGDGTLKHNAEGVAAGAAVSSNLNFPSARWREEESRRLSSAAVGRQGDSSMFIESFTASPDVTSPIPLRRSQSLERFSGLERMKTRTAPVTPNADTPNKLAAAALHSKLAQLRLLGHRRNMQSVSAAAIAGGVAPPLVEPKTDASGEHSDDSSHDHDARNQVTRHPVRELLHQHQSTHNSNSNQTHKNASSRHRIHRERQNSLSSEEGSSPEDLNVKSPTRDTTAAPIATGVVNSDASRGRTLLHVHYNDFKSPENKGDTLKSKSPPSSSPPEVSSSQSSVGEEDWNKPSRAASFRAFNLRTDKRRRNRPGFQTCAGMAGHFISNFFLWGFVVFIIISPALAISHKGNNIFLTCAIAVVAYLGLLMLVWTFLLILVSRGRFHREIMRSLYCRRRCRLHMQQQQSQTGLNPPYVAAAGYPSSTPGRRTSLRSLPKDNWPASQDYNSGGPGNSGGNLYDVHRLPSNTCSEGDAHMLQDKLPYLDNAPLWRRPSLVNDPVLKRVHTSSAALGGPFTFKRGPAHHGGGPFSTSVTKFSNPIHKIESGPIQLGTGPDGGTTATRRMASEADLVYFFWTTHKQRVQQNTRQNMLFPNAGNDQFNNNLGSNLRGIGAPKNPQFFPQYHQMAPQVSNDFAVPTVMTTGQLMAPSSHHFSPFAGNVRRFTGDRALRNGLGDEFQDFRACNEVPGHARSMRPSFLIHPFGIYHPNAPADDLADLKRIGQTALETADLGEPKRRMRFSRKLHNFRLRLINFLLQLHDLPAFQISILIRNCAWVGVYIYLMSAIRRDSVNDSWDTSLLPQTFWQAETTFMWMISWDYLLMLAAAPDKLRHVLGFSSLVDLSTMGTAKFLVSLFDLHAADQYTIYFGSLRVLRLVRIESLLLHVVPWISEVKLKVASLFVGSMVILLMFACLMFALEAPAKKSGYSSLYSYFFFAVVTISTVGFGDFIPDKNISKAIVMVAIFTALAFLPSQIQKLISTLQAPPLSLGRIPTESSDYVVIAGPVSPRQLARICREWSVSLPGCCKSLLVLAPTSVSEYSGIIRTAYIRGGMRVAAMRDQPGSLKLRHYYKNARAVFVVGNVRPSEVWQSQGDASQSNDYEARQLLDDHQTLMRFLGAQHVCWPERPVCVQLNDGTTKHLVTEMGAYHVVCLQHVKMKLMAKSCGGCPGFITLIVNLFHQPSDELELRSMAPPPRNAAPGVLANAANARNYWRGAHYQLYRLEFPRCFYGLQYSILARYLMVQYDVFLLGVSCVTKEYWLNPIGYCVGDELESFTDWPFAGIVAAPSLAVVQEIVALRRLPIPPEILRAEDHHLRRKKRDRASILAVYQRTIAALHTPTSAGSSSCAVHSSTVRSLFHEDGPTDMSGAGAATPCVTGGTTAHAPTTLTRQPSDDSTSSECVVPDVLNTYVGLREVQDVDAALRHVFREPNLPLIVVCGWPRGIPVFLATVCRTTRSNVIILAPDYPPGLAPDNFLPFANCCAWVRGSAIDVTDLLRAGVLQATSCAVFSAPQVPWRTHFNVEKTDTQAILAREFIYALHNSDTLMERRLGHLLKLQQANVATAWNETPLTDTAATSPGPGLLTGQGSLPFLGSNRRPAISSSLYTPGSTLGQSLFTPNSVTNPHLYLSGTNLQGGATRPHNLDRIRAVAAPSVAGNTVSIISPNHHERSRPRRRRQTSVKSDGRKSIVQRELLMDDPSYTLAAFPQSTPSPPQSDVDASADNPANALGLPVADNRFRQTQFAEASVPNDTGRPAPTQDVTAQRRDMDADNAGVPQSARGGPLVIVELKLSSHIEYMQSTPLPSSLSWTGRVEQGDDDWTQDGAYVNNPEFSSGRVLLEEMLHGMITCALPVSRFCMDTRVIDHFVEGVHMPLPPGTKAQSPLLLENLPERYKLSTFGALMSYCLREELKLVIGICRQVDRSVEIKTPLDLLQGDDSSHFLVITCPPMDMLMCHDDKMYIINPCPVEALGALFEGC